MIDLIRRLRSDALACRDTSPHTSNLETEAADSIVELEQENAEMMRAIALLRAEVVSAEREIMSLSS